MAEQVTIIITIISIITLVMTFMQGKGKGKAITLQAWTGPEGSRRLRLPDFKAIGTGRW